MLEDLVRFQLGIDREAVLGGSGGLRHEAARRIVSTLAGQPALLRELAPSSESPADAQATRELDSDIMAESCGIGMRCCESRRNCCAMS